MTDEGTRADAPAAPAPRPTRWLVPLLIVSLALNLLVAGILIAGYFRAHPPERMSSSSFSQILPRSFVRELPEARRQQLRPLFERHKPAFREDRRALRDAALAVADALAREPFDEAQARAAVATYAERSRSLVDLGMKVVSEVVVQLNAGERQTLAERIRSRASMSRSRKKE